MQKIRGSPLSRGATRLALPLALLLAVLCPASTVAATWSLQNLQLSTSAPPSGPLQKTLRGGPSLGEYGFVGEVGGVAFAATATLSPKLRGDTLKLLYDRSKPDGERFAVELAGRSHPQSVADWILVPAARYADSPYNACVSLFGPKTDARVYDILYHEALEDTLLGMRVLQADILFFDLSQTWDLPRLDGRLVLGAGESAPEELDRESAGELATALDRGEFQSWVLTDVGVEVPVDLLDGTLSFDGEPYYYFWRGDFEAYEAEWSRLAGLAKTARGRGDVAEHNRIARQIEALEPRVVAVPAITDALRQRHGDLRRFNPPVVDAVTALMRYAAFFRAVRRHHPQAWTAFLRALPARAEPAVETPTRWAKPQR